MNDKQILIVGDIHGNFKSLVSDITRKGIEDAYLICVGDLGIGFNYSREGEIKGCRDLNAFMQDRNIHFMSIRGNHDDPCYFKKGSSASFSNFELLEDYTIRELNGEKFLFVGGAVSIDRIYRKENISYWRDELFIFDESKAQECDVLITHSTPTWIGPLEKDGISGWCEKDSTLWEECLTERKDHDKLFAAAKPKRSYHGHFHLYSQVENNGTIATILDELQIIEHRNNKIFN
jgi:UDP-2,3-diacylglucosamine pyrophosphatase LpxH